MGPSTSRESKGWIIAYVSVVKVKCLRSDHILLLNDNVAYVRKGSIWGQTLIYTPKCGISVSEITHCVFQV